MNLYSAHSTRSSESRTHTINVGLIVLQPGAPIRMHQRINILRCFDFSVSGDQKYLPEDRNTFAWSISDLQVDFFFFRDEGSSCVKKKKMLTETESV